MAEFDQAMQSGFESVMTGNDFAVQHTGRKIKQRLEALSEAVRVDPGAAAAGLDWCVGGIDARHNTLETHQGIQRNNPGQNRTSPQRCTGCFLVATGLLV